MSYDALYTSEEQPRCEKCQQLINDREEIVSVLETCLSYVPEGYEENTPEQKWCVDFDWHNDHIYHKRCWESMK
jgi:hypothetical protein